MTTDAERLISSLEGTDRLRETVLRAAIAALHLPSGSRGLDIGCGTGGPALLLAEATRPGGHVTGLDISWPLVRYARGRAGRSHFAGCLSFEQGDMSALPFAPRSFDWVWSVDCVGYPAGDLPCLLKSIGRVVRPGGVVALMAWSSQQVLPGHMMLEARLNAVCSPYAAHLDGRPPRAQFLRALRAFDQVGLSRGTCTTFVGQMQAPLAPEIREGLALLFDMLWGSTVGQASRADAEEYRRLCVPTSPDFIGDLPEYCGFFTYTMFTGQVTTAP